MMEIVSPYPGLSVMLTAAKIFEHLNFIRFRLAYPAAKKLVHRLTQEPLGGRLSSSIYSINQ